ncbi:hypothetical protein U0C82_09635 [Fulvimarina sp. 2208YS6-2-32]|uniref:Uncharacterized protein n=1 Tax=Fulvimarina uroteuthidis TaxID=3098149 RepID=A0ABU5I5H5_9HYPH|nr:hypothetical protein [Fulvimarina sp. 2208YS6-2-32]MDY8109401.1 hypothetical protein [Fulvimarina sp. 2208YS6-2-32]
MADATWIDTKEQVKTRCASGTWQREAFAAFDLLMMENPSRFPCVFGVSVCPVMSSIFRPVCGTARRLARMEQSI